MPPRRTTSRNLDDVDQMNASNINMNVEMFRMMRETFKGMQEEQRIHNETTQLRLDAMKTQLERNQRERDIEGTSNPRFCNTEVSYKEFLNAKPKEFEGTTDPIRALNWLRDMEKVFKASRAEEGRKALLASLMFRESAAHWWDSVMATLEENAIETMTWKQFRGHFEEQYCPKEDMKQMERKFMNLKQRDKTVVEYVAEFQEKSRFAEYQVATEERKADLFIEGLRREIQAPVLMTEPKTFKDAVKAAKNAEKGFVRKVNIGSHGRKDKNLFLDGITKGPRMEKKEFKIQESKNKKGCRYCQKIHLGRCFKGTGIC